MPHLHRYFLKILLDLKQFLTIFLKFRKSYFQKHLPINYSIRVHLASKQIYPVDTGRKLNVYKTFRRRPGRLLNILCTFNLRPVSTG